MSVTVTESLCYDGSRMTQATNNLSGEPTQSDARQQGNRLPITASAGAHATGDSDNERATGGGVKMDLYRRW